MIEIPARTIPGVAIVGRPNVGKSSLFNALIGRRLSIVHELPGVTRDRVTAPCRAGGGYFELIDTGGLGQFASRVSVTGRWDAGIADQVAEAVKEAAVLILVTDITGGVVELDREMARRMRALGKPVLLAVNKCDNEALDREAAEFSELGFGEIFPISCSHRRGIADLVSAVVRHLPAHSGAEAEEDEDDRVRITIAGRPNVGKSTLVNALLGAERVMTSPEAGTTRDAVDAPLTIEWRGDKIPVVLTDTAGLRRQGKALDAVERYSAMRAGDAIKRADIVLLVVEASPEGFTAQDRRIGAMIGEAGCGCIIVANKFDLVRDRCTQREMLKEIRSTMPSLAYAPVVFASALDASGMKSLLDAVCEVVAMSRQTVSTGVVNRIIADAAERRSAPVVGVSPLRIYYANMIGTKPPKFLLFVNNPKNCAPEYLAYLRRALRETLDWTGFPIELVLRARPKTIEAFHDPARTSRRPPKPGRRS